jgi:hypothetical protein
LASLPVFVFPRSESSLLFAPALEHTAQIAGTPNPIGMAGFQLGRVISAFQVDTLGDRSPFYHFSRPIVDPSTLVLALVGSAGTIVGLRRRRAWLLPLALAATAFLVTVGTVNPPDYPRLSLLLPALALLAAAPLVWLWSLGRGGMVAALVVTAGIGALNLWWFFVEYPQQGQGSFEHVILMQMAERAPVYVVTPNYFFGYETLRLLDQEHRVQPPPQNPDPNATWVAVGPEAEVQLTRLRPSVPRHELRPFLDNAGRVVLYALVPT